MINQITKVLPGVDYNINNFEITYMQFWMASILFIVIDGQPQYESYCVIFKNRNNVINLYDELCVCNRNIFVKIVSKSF